MNKLFEYLAITLLLAACSPKSEPNALVMPVSNTIKVNETDGNDTIMLKAAHVVPTPNQYDALKNEFIAFIHFGPNTFTRMEWGDGMEDPKIFNLQNLDTDQWCKAMKDAGMKMVIFTAKHHDGFVLWQSRYTKHGVMASPFKDGKGDVLKELADSCKKYGLKLGVYLSPADLFQIENKEGLYGNLSEYTERTIPRAVEGRPFENSSTFTFKVDDYNEYFLNQLFELLTEYGPIHEVWFDGAHPKRKGGQTYNYLAWKELIRALAPKAVIFGKEDIRWCGNESGGTRDTEWNVIPYQEDPDQMISFPDLTEESLGSREEIYKGKYLHYQQAETNTSIREGWFYRDDMDQKVRSTDDVFDMYERSVGGNSTFLLNIPPNREGKFSPRDVTVLEEVGQRINETYSVNLLSGANGPQAVLDDDLTSFELIGEGGQEIVIETNAPITTNRLAIQEAIDTHSERVEKHALDAWVDNAWKEIATGTNIGYKRILRFPEVTTQKLRIRILESRFYPAIANISAHYYKARPPQLSIERSVDGSVTISPKKDTFGWKPHGEDVMGNINSGYKIHYTTDGSEPTSASAIYNEAFEIPSGEVKAVSEVNGQLGSIASQLFGIIKKDWKVLGVDSVDEENAGQNAFDGDQNTYWSSEANSKVHYIDIDLGKEYAVTGFNYTPQTTSSEGMIERGVVKISQDGKSWRNAEDFRFGNLKNDPTTRTLMFQSKLNTRYIRIESKEIAGNGKTAAIAELDFLLN
ncbi:alpha-1,3/4-fucosidase [Arenibacter sp. TNZ]|jgi:alpha-L-fucosidase|uniref:alpha-L-fucosidase n=1 Tax=Arenibacter TaxID=178469 RepID=UPI000CD4207F|nr:MULTISPECIES: alpha-L-fucosidase [Arenibacter]MCM4171556.1 alpha-1,3/4-fucosidase [Arenibacter sp. TNZ]